MNFFLWISVIMLFKCYGVWIYFLKQSDIYVKAKYLILCGWVQKVGSLLECKVYWLCKYSISCGTWNLWWAFHWIRLHSQTHRSERYTGTSKRPWTSLNEYDMCQTPSLLIIHVIWLQKELLSMRSKKAYCIISYRIGGHQHWRTLDFQMGKRATHQY